MKKRTLAIRVSVLLMVIAACASCATMSTPEPAGEYPDDAAITARIKSLLAADDFLKRFQIGVETYRGAVQLSGFVNSHRAVTKAVEIVKGVDGVASIKTRLIVK